MHPRLASHVLEQLLTAKGVQRGLKFLRSRRSSSRFRSRGSTLTGKPSRPVQRACRTPAADTADLARYLPARRIAKVPAGSLQEGRLQTLGAQRVSKGAFPAAGGGASGARPRGSKSRSSAHASVAVRPCTPHG